MYSVTQRMILPLYTYEIKRCIPSGTDLSLTSCMNLLVAAAAAVTAAANTRRLSYANLFLLEDSFASFRDFPFTATFAGYIDDEPLTFLNFQLIFVEGKAFFSMEKYEGEIPGFGNSDENFVGGI